MKTFIIALATFALGYFIAGYPTKAQSVAQSAKEQGVNLAQSGVNYAKTAKVPVPPVGH